MKLAVQDGCFRYPGSERQVLDHIDFRLDSGGVLAILGPNGAGKTTLLRCMIGLLRWQAGETRLDERPLSSIPARALWRSVSYVPQARQAPAAYSVEDMVLLGRASYVKPFSQPGEADREAAQLALEKVGLEALSRRSCAELSGGEYQMVLIARALASEPRLLILDEPESNLDFRNQLRVLTLMNRLAGEGITCIFNTHYPAHALRWASHALMLGRDGQSVFGSAAEVVTEDHILRYFGVRCAIGTLPGTDCPAVIPLAEAESGQILKTYPEKEI